MAPSPARWTRLEPRARALELQDPSPPLLRTIGAGSFRSEYNSNSNEAQIHPVVGGIDTLGHSGNGSIRHAGVRAARRRVSPARRDFAFAGSRALQGGRTGSRAAIGRTGVQSGTP